MFSGDSSDTMDTTIEGTMELDLEELGFDFSKVTSKNGFLTGNKCIKKINLTPFNSLIFKTSELSGWFNGASSLVEIDLTPIHSNSTLNTLNRLFNNCVRLTKIIGLENLDTTGLNGYYSVYRMFYNCKALKKVNLSTLNTSNITNSGNPSTSGFSSMFEKCESLESLDISNFVINTNVTALHYMFKDCKSLVSIKLPNFNTSSNIRNTYSMFENCESLKTVDDWSKLPWATLTSMRNMFLNSGIESIDMTISSDIPNTRGIDMFSMFKDCTNLKKVNAKAIGANSGGNNCMASIFENCINLEEVDLSNYYNNSYNQQANKIFKNCRSLKIVKLHHVAGEYICGNTNYWYSPSSMFENCESLEVLDLRYLFKSSVIQMGYGTNMFANCRKLRKLDLRGSDYGQLGTDNSSWQSGTNNTFLNCGVDNDSPTIVYTSNARYQRNLITLGNKFGLGWSTENVIVVEDPEEEVDMS